MSRFDQNFWVVTRYNSRMLDLSLGFKCPICGAVPQEQCRMLSGSFRFESHIERKWIAVDHSLGRVLPQSSPMYSKRAARVARMNAPQ